MRTNKMPKARIAKLCIPNKLDKAIVTGKRKVYKYLLSAEMKFDANGDGPTYELLTENGPHTVSVFLTDDLNARGERNLRGFVCLRTGQVDLEGALGV
jgi:hypothetical protein